VAGNSLKAPLLSGAVLVFLLDPAPLGLCQMLASPRIFESRRPCQHALDAPVVCVCCLPYRVADD
jgi:hypothetical protein